MWSSNESRRPRYTVYRSNAAGYEGSGSGHQGEIIVNKGVIAVAAAIMFVPGIGLDKNRARSTRSLL